MDNCQFWPPGGVPLVQTSGSPSITPFTDLTSTLPFYWTPASNFKDLAFTGVIATSSPWCGDVPFLLGRGCGLRMSSSSPPTVRGRGEAAEEEDPIFWKWEGEGGQERWHSRKTYHRTRTKYRDHWLHNKLTITGQLERAPYSSRSQPSLCHTPW